MYATQIIQKFSLSLGQLRGVRVRLSLLMFVAMAALMWRLGSLPLGLLASAILLLSILLHQLAQFFVAHATGNELSEIVLWPLGGLTTQAPDAPFATHAQIQIVGPLVNLALAITCLFQLQHMNIEAAALNPFAGFQLQPDEPLARTAGRMIYFANVMLLCVNLFPVVPFDAGRVLCSFLSERYDAVKVTHVMLRLGLAISLIGMTAGFIFDQSTIVALSGFVLILHLYEIGLNSTRIGYVRIESEDDYKDEFAELEPELEDIDSYRSNNEDTDTDELISRSSMMARRSARKQSEQQRRDAAERKKEEEQVDAILQRIHCDGENSLKPAELYLLRKVSQRYRKQLHTRERNTETGR